MVPVGDILPNPYQPRRYFDPDSIRELAGSIRENGILNPLTIRWEDGRPVLIAGERRLRAAKMAGLLQVPCVAVEETQGDRPAVLALIENMQRVDMNCFEEAEAIGRLLSTYGLTQAQAAERLGYSQPTVANKLRLLRLPENIRRQMVGAGLTERHARALLRLDEEKQAWVLDRVIGEQLTVAQTERLVDAVVRGQPPRRPPVWAVRDVRLFLNTVQKAVDVMRQAGVPAELERQEQDDAVVFTIRIPSFSFEKRKGAKEN
ncbi:MAG: ParB/RepB/Spo0J family partition protein [Ruminococcaceae bacterium]|nr:ParB/RepB/Spo0J family partition protein [Oscillospiraceae bacterium]